MVWSFSCRLSPLDVLMLLLHALSFVAAQYDVKKSDKDVTIVAIVEKADLNELKNRWDAAFNKQTALTFNVKPVLFEEGQEYPSYVAVEKAVLEGVSLILDLTWRGWEDAFTVASEIGVPYLRLDITIMQFVNSADDFLQNRNASDAALIFPSDEELDQALNYLVGNTVIRLLVLHGLNTTVTGKLRAMRPMPSNYVIYGTTTEIHEIFEIAYKGNLVTRESRWTLAYEDFGTIDHSRQPNGTITKIRPDPSVCCSMQGKSGNNCNCGSNVKIQNLFATVGFEIIADIFSQIKKTKGEINSILTNCSADNLPKPPAPETNDTFMRHYEMVVASNPQVVKEGLLLKLKLATSVVTLTPTKTTEKMGVWSTTDGFTIDPSQANKVIKRFFRIGIAETRPFTYTIRHENGTEKKDGFCIRLLEKIAEKMDFEYQLVEPIDNAYGAKDENGSWNGLVGDLVNGATDIVVAALTMTSEREEVIDFVAPHFDQSGISIVMRKPEKEVSLFKFMSVLEPEVWWCILAAIIVTAVVLWLLDKYSPFSGQNKKRYPYECRKFTLVECFWFALTSITPQGGGEPPKAVSGRILVAAYWLFVVLMLATFTANLAAFLTVERMQSPVGSLEELAKQSKINYTVVKGSSIEQYFRNMAAAEDDLYRVWKDMTLNSSTDQAKYRVWDYPIKEQYNRILNVILKTGPVSSDAEGYRKLIADKDGEFAFIHDAAEIRYEVYRSCNLMEIGEPFAEQPYAIAVQSGSHLQEEISKVLLELQKDRYFEQLYNVFWNASKRRECPNYEEAEGITLQSLGGVFIATLVGLAIGMLTLLGEVLMYKRNQKNNIQPIENRGGTKMLRPQPVQQPRIRSTLPRSRFTYRY